MNLKKEITRKKRYTNKIQTKQILKEIFLFLENLALFFCYLHFEIHPFALLPSNLPLKF